MSKPKPPRAARPAGSHGPSHPGGGHGRKAPPAHRPTPSEPTPVARSTRVDDKLIRIAGLPSVVEIFKTAPERVERLYFDADHKDRVKDFCAVLAKRRKIFRQLGPDEMKRVAATAMHGGIVAMTHPKPIHDLDMSRVQSWASAGKPLLVLDGVGNPQNMGAIVRTAAFFGIENIVLSDHEAQAGLSDTSYRIAKGGLERVEVYRAAHLPDVLQRISGLYHVVGTAIGRGKSIAGILADPKPVALVLGNEENGLPSATIAACQSIVTLRGGGAVQSLNVSATAAILIHSLLSARPPAGGKGQA